jgi:hypothetical protein
MSMFEYSKLTDDTDAEISYGAGYGHDGYGPALTVLDWIWTECNVDGGKGFTDSLVSPLAGNYKSIEANGEAWTSVGTNFGLLAANLLSNGTALATNHWEGDAATAFTQFLDVFWQKCAVWAGEKVGTFVAAGFNKIAEVSKAIAQLAIDAIIRAAARIATKAIPFVGWAWGVLESAAKWVGKLFGVDIKDLIDDIQAIVEMVPAVLNLFDAMKNIVETMQNYFNTLEELVNTVKQIPERSATSRTPWQPPNRSTRAPPHWKSTRPSSRRTPTEQTTHSTSSTRSPKSRGVRSMGLYTPEMDHAERELNARADYAHNLARALEAKAEQFEQRFSKKGSPLGRGRQAAEEVHPRPRHDRTVAAGTQAHRLR